MSRYRPAKGNFLSAIGLRAVGFAQGLGQLPTQGFDFRAVGAAGEAAFCFFRAEYPRKKANLFLPVQFFTEKGALPTRGVALKDFEGILLLLITTPRDPNKYINCAIYVEKMRESFDCSTLTYRRLLLCSPLQNCIRRFVRTPYTK